MSDTITHWLEKLGLGQYAGAFAEHAIELQHLAELDHDALKEIGVRALGHRLSILKAAANPEPEAGEATEATSATPADPSPSREAERRQLTVMFCDLAGSTELSQRLDPEDLREINRAYQDICKAAIERYDGYVARYMGDGVLAYFGFPQAHEDDAERAIHAGLAVVESIERLGEPGDRLGVRVGIATGLVVVGDLIGEGASLESAVVGETPNLAARLQGCADENTVVVSASTRELARGSFEYADLGARELKGIARPVPVWQVTTTSDSDSRFEALHAATGTTPLVGREHELGLLLDRWQYAREGEGQVALLSGESGIGKSRIAETLRARTATDDPIRLRHQCSPYHTNSALHPFIEQLKRAARFEIHDSPAIKLEKLEALLSQGSQDSGTVAPLFASLLSIPMDGRYPPLELAPEQQKEATLAALVAQLEGLSSHQPVLVVFEDAQWADPTSLELLGQLVDRAQHTATLIVITFRPEFVPPWTAHSHITSLTLNRFTRSQVETMVGQITGGKPLPEDVREQILAKTDGVPLFVEELTRTVIESDLVEDQGDHFALTGPMQKVGIPNTLQDSLMARLDRLAGVKEVVQQAAVLGRTFELSLLANASSMDDTELDQALNRLTEAGLLFRQGSPPDMSYTFKHGMVQEVAYASLLKNKRRQLHARVADALSTQSAQPEPELLAYHFSEAGQARPAIEHWHRAAQRALQMSASHEAAEHAARALEQLQTLPQSQQRELLELELQITRGAALINTIGTASAEVRQTYERARKLSERVGEREKNFTATWGVWLHHTVRGAFDAARRVADDVVQAGNDLSDSVYVLQGHHAAWSTAGYTGDFLKGLEHVKQGLAVYDINQHARSAAIYGGHDAGVCGNVHMGYECWALGYPDQARTGVENSVRLGENLAQPMSLEMARCHAALIHQLRGEPEIVRQYAQDSLVNCQRHKLDTWENNAEILLGWALASLGDVKRGVPMMRDAVDARETMGARIRQAYFLAILAELLGNCGETDEGLDTIQRALVMLEQSQEQRWESLVYRVHGDLLYAHNDEARCETALVHALEFARQRQAKSFELSAAHSLAQLRREQGRHTEARDLLAPVYRWFTEGLDTPVLRRTDALLGRLAQ